MRRPRRSHATRDRGCQPRHRHTLALSNVAAAAAVLVRAPVDARAHVELAAPALKVPAAKRLAALEVARGEALADRALALRDAGRALHAKHELLRRVAARARGR